jgi:hypothetical protein
MREQGTMRSLRLSGPLVSPWIVLACLTFTVALTEVTDAHEDPQGCFEGAQASLIISAFRANGTTGVVGSISECETIVFQARLQKPQDSDTICAFSGGMFVVRTPDGVEHHVSDDVPCIGGTSLEGCDDTVKSIDSLPLSYTVAPGDIVAGFVTATATYSGGVGHVQPGNSDPDVSAFVSRPLPVVLCADDNFCTIDQCDTAAAGAGACSFPPIVCNDNDLCTSEACNPANGLCIVSPPFVCNDNNACTTEACNTETGQCDTTSVTVCNDNDLCTQDACDPATGQCTFVDVVSETCDDNNACTFDECNPATGVCGNADVVTATCGNTLMCPPGACDPGACTTECNPITGLCVNPGNGCSVCGDGIVQPGEECDSPPNGVPGSCCDATCQLRPASALCRTGGDSCQADAHCTGSSATCPSNLPKAAGSACRPEDDDDNPCTIERCNGTETTCAHIAGNAGAPCADDGNPCTLDRCNGTNPICGHPAGNPGTICHPRILPCETEERCTGDSPICPTSFVVPDGGACPEDARDDDPCTRDECHGGVCFHPIAAPFTTICREQAFPCDALEYCDRKLDCPPDGFLSPGDQCDDGEEKFCTDDTCDADLSCVHTPKAAGTACGPAPQECDGEGNCLPCGNGTLDAGEECDGGKQKNGNADFCCTDTCKLRSTDHTCRPQANGFACDPAETCDGGHQDCPADALEDEGTTCGTPGQVCNREGRCVDLLECGNGVANEYSQVDGQYAIEQCDLGTSNSDDFGSESCCSTRCTLQSPSFVCRVSDNPCVASTQCPGGSADCPAQTVVLPNGTDCSRNDCILGASCDDGVCDGGARICDADARISQQTVKSFVRSAQVKCESFLEQQGNPTCDFEVRRPLGEGLTDYGKTLIQTSALSRRTGNATPSAKCTEAATQVRAGCGSIIGADVLLCAKKAILLGSYSPKCELAACGRALKRFARACPGVIDKNTKTLSDDVLSTITGLEVEQRALDPQKVDKRCPKGKRRCSAATSGAAR